jgi:tripartite-type tricarboxylate transporter receptor subunit TctC
MPALVDVMGGQIEAAVPIYLPQARSATILAVTSADRIPFISDIPTAREGGVDLIARTWIAFMAPAGTPPEVIAKVNKALNEYFVTPEGKQAFTNAGIRPLGGTPAQLADQIKQDRALWAPIIEKEGIKLDTK